MIERFELSEIEIGGFCRIRSDGSNQGGQAIVRRKIGDGQLLKKTLELVNTDAAVSVPIEEAEETGEQNAVRGIKQR